MSNLSLQDLRTLNLANNQIGEITSRPFSKLSKLQHLDLSDNHLKDLPPEVFRDISVSVFDVDIVFTVHSLLPLFVYIHM